MLPTTFSGLMVTGPQQGLTDPCVFHTELSIEERKKAFFVIYV
jgi:hypothetical protein